MAFGSKFGFGIKGPRAKSPRPLSLKSSGNFNIADKSSSAISPSVPAFKNMMSGVSKSGGEFGSNFGSKQKKMSFGKKRF